MLMEPMAGGVGCPAWNAKLGGSPQRSAKESLLGEGHGSSELPLQVPDSEGHGEKEREWGKGYHVLPPFCNFQRGQSLGAACELCI